jgi:hypothetical protein
MLRLIRGYYLATPVFLFADVFFGINIRVAFLDQWPAGKWIYYIFAFVLGIIAWRRPELIAKIGLIESGADIVFIILSTAIWYGGMLDVAGSEFGMPVPIPATALVNFALAAVIAGVSYTLQSAGVVRQ